MSLFFVSFILGSFGAWFVIRYKDKIGLNDIPNHRSSHVTVIPKGGGIGILLTTILASLMLSIPVNFWLSALAISLTSMWGGDKHLLSAKQRLFIQFGCSVFFLIFFLYSRQVALSTYLLCVPISVFIVGTSNFYNFMDGIDGITGITGVVGFALLSLYSFLFGTGHAHETFCLAIVFSCLGFLCFNMPKARVFLGDIGSVLLGFMFSCLVIVLSENIIDFIVMAGFLAPFYFDEIFTMIERIKNGDSLIIAHRKHIYQLLANELGISHWKISLLYGCLQMIIGLSIIFIKPKGVWFILLAYLIYGLIFTMVSIMIRKKASVK